ncbi:alcohol dehydrogenase catalytic domain-containing protein [Sulfobacillus sp. DSM 109850]|uniref:Alcohol dehydrogenase n=1 Tax=Sulfobacillus harzensis TaxID=2729629 RepID=A0A7Y0Q5K1_9FIRM|nr:alcohol dehydrogenase catalytic domain-containing protein [Sulfobacillus harzensis]
MVEYKRPLQIREVPIPEPHGEAVLVKIGGSGLCHSDLHLMSGERPKPLPLPFTLGHENAGWVAAVGDSVQSVKVGDAVAVYGGWSTHPDRFTWLGMEQLTDVQSWVGIGTTGGYADYLLVPSYRYLLPLNGLDPVEAAPLTDAGLTPYRAIKKILPHLYPGATIVLIGAGGLGQFGVQYAKALAPACQIIVLDINEEKLAMARTVGADVVLNGSRDDVIDQVKRLTEGEGAQGIVDFVGSDATMAQAAALAGRRAKVVLAACVRSRSAMPSLRM